jgi:glycosyltransferase involved in cell wall biosynthesis
LKVSLLTVTLNNKETIPSCLESLQMQDYIDIEHIVKDGASKDNTLDIVKSLSPQSMVLTGKDTGIYDALNQAIEKSTGDVIGILHADDLYASANVISHVVRTFETAKCDAVYGDLNYVDRMDTGKVIRTWKSGEYTEGDFLKGWMPPHPAFFVRREIIEKYGAYNLSFKSAADYEWMLRLIHKHKIKLAYLPKTLVAMRLGGQSNASLINRFKANMEDRRAWKVNGLKPKWYTMYLKPLKKITQYKYFVS